MSKDPTEDTRNAGLWLRSRHGFSAEPRPEPDEANLLLAGYLDGTLDEPARNRAEAWLASDSEAVDRLIALRAELVSARPVAPSALIERAQGLIRADARPAPKTGLAALFAGMTGLFQPMALATAAAVFVACIVGFQLGRSGYESVAAEPSPPGDFGLGIEPGSEDLI